jgi:hypothetical protein
MPLPKERLEAIEKLAEELVQNIADPKEAQKAKERYIKSTVNLNKGIEFVLDTFESEALPLLRDLYPAHPMQIYSVLNVQKNRLRAIAADVIKGLEPVNNVAFKIMCASYVHEILDVIIDNDIATTTELLEEEKELS